MPNKKYFKLNYFVILIAIFFVAGSIYFFSRKAEAQTATVYLTGNAWSSNIGWISFATSTNNTNGVTVDSTGNLNGYAWSSNIGWVKFGNLATSTMPSGSGTTAVNAKYSTTTGQITGWARACGGSGNSDCTDPAFIGIKIRYSIASSADGTKLATVAINDYIYTSTDSGVTWIRKTSAGLKNWYAITSSSDGTKLAAITTAGDYLYTSTDSGVTWVQQNSLGSKVMQSITSSADGTKLTSVIATSLINGYIYTSTDSGVTWVQRTSSGLKAWKTITTSADGTVIAAIAFNNDYVYTSTDSGATWTQRTSSGLKNRYSITSSSDGTKLATVVYNDYIYTSPDSGATWIQRNTTGSKIWESITSSSDGTKLAAVAYNDYIYTSADSGATWIQRTSSGLKLWRSITSSTDGKKLVAVADNDYIYTSTDSGATWTQRTGITNTGWDGWISLSGTGYGISTTTPSTLTSAPLSGFAWGSEVVGWLGFSNVSINNPCSLTNSCVPVPVIPSTFVLSVSGSSCTNISLSWTSVSGAQTYNIYRATVALPANWIKIATTSSSSYLDNNSLVPNTTYFYKISASNVAGESSLNNSAVSSSPCGGNNCTNGATNYPQCNKCDSPKIYDSVGKFCHFVSASPQIQDFSVKPNTINKGGNCNLSWTLASGSVDASTTCYVSVGGTQISPSLDPNYVTTYGGLGTKGINSETRYTLSCGEIDAPSSSYSNWNATCNINPSSKEVN